MCNQSTKCFSEMSSSFIKYRSNQSHCFKLHMHPYMKFYKFNLKIIVWTFKLQFFTVILDESTLEGSTNNKCQTICRTTLNYGLSKISPLGRVDHWPSTFIIFRDFQDSDKLKRHQRFVFLETHS